MLAMDTALVASCGLVSPACRSSEVVEPVWSHIIHMSMKPLQHLRRMVSNSTDIAR